jgi:branched-subunit amino acid ABC-type transport system permease component
MTVADSYRRGVESVLGWIERAPRRTLVATGAGLGVSTALVVLALVLEPRLFVEQAIGGLVQGMLLVMVALGLSLTLGLMGVVNFAHGALFMFGGYLAYQAVGVWGLPFWVALLVVPVAVGVLGIAMEVTVLRPLYGTEPIISLLATFGVTLMLQQAAEAIWGATPLGFARPPLLDGSTNLGVTTVSTYRLFAVAASAVAVVAVYYLITETDFGLTVRAGVQDGEMTEFLGANLPVQFTAMFFLGSAIAGFGGVLQAAEFGVDLNYAEQFVILAFVVVVVGGAGSLFGSVVAGILIGEAQFVVPVVLTALAETLTGTAEAAGAEWATPYLALVDLPGVQDVIPFVVMIVVLLVRPRGLFGEEGFLE